MARDGNSISILLISDQDVVRAGLRMLLETWDPLEVIAEAEDLNDAITKAGKMRPDIVLADLDRSLDAEILDKIHEVVTVAGSRFILLTGSTDPYVHHYAIGAGTKGIVFKAHAASELLKAILKVHEGELWLSRKFTAAVVTELTSQKAASRADPEIAMLNSLTAREREVATLVCDGLKNKAIGEKLFISETTVRHHMSSIFKKLNVKSRFELLVFLHRHWETAFQSPAQKPSDTRSR